MVDGIVWCVLGLIIGYAVGHNRVSVTRERLIYQNQLKSKDVEIELLEQRLKSCQKWSKEIANEYTEYRKNK
jgi:hypothetical protein